MARTSKKPCRRCWVPTCRNAKPKEAARKKLFLFPRDVARCREWVKAIGDTSLAETELRKLNSIRFVCEDHFPPSKITPQVRPAADAVPVIFSPVRVPLNDTDLQAFDLQVVDDHDMMEDFKRIEVSPTIVVNQDSCMSFTSSEHSHSSLDQPHVLDHNYAIGSEEGLEAPEGLADLSDSWLELSLPGFDDSESNYHVPDTGPTLWTSAEEASDRVWLHESPSSLPGLFPQLTEFTNIPDPLGEDFRC